jgi:spermidine/putrescine transport system substrate-binding protein
MQTRQNTGHSSLLRTLGRRKFLAGAAATAAATTTLGRVQASTPQVVNVWNWSEYIAETTLQDFSDATGIAVNYTIFETNDEVLEAMQAGNPNGQDVIFPSSEYVESMVRSNLLDVLDHSLLTNVFNIDPFFMQASFDIGRAYSLPYFWGTVGLGFRRSVNNPTTWAEVFSPDSGLGRIGVMATTDTIQAALKALGYSANSTNSGQISEAADLVIAAKPHITKFLPDSASELLLSDEVDVAMDWNGSVLQAMDEDEGIGFVVPEEGSMLWEDTMCIPVGAPNRDNAHAFINYLLDAQVHAAITNEVYFSSPNLAAREFIDPEILNNPAIYLPASLLAQCEPSFWQGDDVEALYQAALARVLAA